MSGPILTSKLEATQGASLEVSIELARRAFALKKFEQAVEQYAHALELMTAKHGEDAPEAADLYFSYGKALLENAISQTAVLGKEQAEDALGGDDIEHKATGTGAAEGEPFLSFSGDVEDDDALVEEDVAVDLFAEARNAVEEEDRDAEGSDDEDEPEPEDDFNAAWEVLDLARALYEKQQDDDEIKLKLADTYIALGDVSLETEKFDQAIADYTTGTSLKNELLPLSSRQIAEAHYKLSMVLDLTSGRLGDAIQHAEKAMESVEARLAELRNGLSGQVKVEEPAKKDVKGKGKATTTMKLVRDELVQHMSKPQIEAEIKDLEELREDLGLKVEELKTTPDTSDESAPALAAKALDRDLNTSVSINSGPSAGVVNDLTSMVVKKKKKGGNTTGAETNGSGKRKVELEDEINGSEKKVKVNQS